MKQKNDPVLKLTNDAVFKQIFLYNPTIGHHLLKDFLSCFLHISIHSLQLLPTEFTPHPTNGKSIRLDLHAKVNDAFYINIEMQNYSNLEELGPRSLFYASSLFSYYGKEGDDYKKLPSVHVLFLLSFDLFKKAEVHNWIQCWNKRFEILLTDKLNIHMVELRRVEDKAVSEWTEEEKWCRFIRNYGVKGKEEEIKELIEGKEEFRMIDEIMKQLNDPVVRQAIFNRTIMEMDERSRISREKELKEEGEKIGLSKGKDIGEKTAKNEFVKNLLEEGFSLDKAFKVAGVKLEQQEELRQLLKAS